MFLTGEIIHNPHVNEKLRGMGIRFLDQTPDAVETLGAEDVVILPAFGVTVGMLQRLDKRGCTLIDTTCGSVLNVWKNVKRYAEGGYTSVIHGKVWHEETQATASHAVDSGGRYLVVFDKVLSKEAYPTASPAVCVPLSQDHIPSASAMSTRATLLKPARSGPSSPCRTTFTSPSAET